jgi:uncharacterized membrane protein YqiK
MNIHPLIIFFGVLILVLGAAGFILSKLFVRSTKSLAYVRTGYGGETVILNGGDFVLPILHKAIPVSLNSNPIEINRINENSVITKDRLRADVSIVFYLKVNPVDLDIMIAAQTLGYRTMDPSQLSAFLNSLLITSIREAVVEFTLGELLANEQKFVARVRELSVEQLFNYGLLLETTSISFLGQTSITYYDPDNALDAPGLTKITELVETEKKLRNELEQGSRIEICRKQTEADHVIQKLTQEQQKQKFLYEQELVAHQTALRIEKQKADARAAYEKEQSRILVEQKVKLSEQHRDAVLAENAKNQTQVYLDASLAKVRVVKAEEEIETERELARLERMHRISLLEAKAGAEKETLLIRETALAEKQAAQDRAEAYRIWANGKTEALKIIAEGKKSISCVNKELASERYSIHSDGMKSLLNACDVLSSDKYSENMRAVILENLTNVVLDFDKSFDEIAHYDSFGKSEPGKKDAPANSRSRSGLELNDTGDAASQAPAFLNAAHG